MLHRICADIDINAVIAAATVPLFCHCKTGFTCIIFKDKHVKLHSALGVYLHSFTARAMAVQKRRQDLKWDEMTQKIRGADFLPNVSKKTRAR